METLRIAFVYDAVYPWIKGGVEKRIYELARRLAKRHEVHIYGYKLWDGPKDIERENIFYHGAIRPGHLYRRGRRTILPPLFHSIGLLVSLRGAEFDIIDCQSFPYLPPYSVKLSKGHYTLVITWHEFWGDYWNEYLGRAGIFGKLIERSIFRLTSNHVAVSIGTKRRLQNAGLRGRIVVVPNGVDFKRIRSIRSSGLCSDIIFVGRLTKEKISRYY